MSHSQIFGMGKTQDCAEAAQANVGSTCFLTKSGASASRWRLTSTIFWFLRLERPKRPKSHRSQKSPLGMPKIESEVVPHIMTKEASTPKEVSGKLKPEQKADVPTVSNSEKKKSALSVAASSLEQKKKSDYDSTVAASLDAEIANPNPHYEKRGNSPPKVPPTDPPIPSPSPGAFPIRGLGESLPRSMTDEDESPPLHSYDTQGQAHLVPDEDALQQQLQEQKRESLEELPHVTQAHLVSDDLEQQLQEQSRELEE